MPVSARSQARSMGSDWLAGFFATIDAIPSWQLYSAVDVFLLLETTVLIGLVTPGEVVLLAAATTVGTPGEYAALATVAAGASLVGQTGGYGLGRRFGGWIQASWAGRRIGEDNWSRAEVMLRDGRGRVLIGSRFVAVAHSLVPVIASTLRMPLRRFGCYAAIGAGLWGLVYVGLGSAASVAVRNVAHLVGPTVTGLLVAGIVVALVVRTLRRRRAETATRSGQ